MSTHIDPTLSDDELQMEMALDRLAGTVYGIDAGNISGDGDPLINCLGMIAETLRIRLRLPQRDLSGLDAARRLQALGHLSGFRSRAIKLDGQWWQDAAVAMLAFDRNSGEPIAMLPSGQTYIGHDAVGQRTKIDERAAAEIAEIAYIIYPSLPERVTPLAFLRLAGLGTTSEFRGMLIAALGASLLALIQPITLGQLTEDAIPQGRFDLLYELLGLMAGAIIGAALLDVYKAFVIGRLAGKADHYLQTALWDRVLRLQIGFFRQFQTGDIAMRVVGIDAIRRILSGSILSAFLGGVFGFVNFIILFWYNAELARWAALYALAVSLVFVALIYAQVLLRRRSLDLRGRIQAFVVQVVSAMPKLRVAGVERRVFSRWAAPFAEERQFEGRALSHGVIITVLNLMMLPVVSLGLMALYSHPDNSTGTANFIVFNATLGQFLTGIVGMFAAATNAVTIVPLWERIRPVLDAPVEAIDEREDPGSLSGRLSVNNLRFGYGDDGPDVLKGISFEVEPGQFVAIVGGSGSGKSTILRLMLGFETPRAGAILYDGRDLSKLDIHRVREQIGTVLQTAMLLPGTILDNIAGASDKGEADVVKALELAGLTTEIGRMPMGLQTVITAGNSSFSGGQRQRLMIARALINQPKILFFDEATSVLDNRAQRIVSASLEKLAVTRIVIAHRLSTIQSADRILVLSEGEIAEQGTFAELMERQGLFAALARRQVL